MKDDKLEFKQMPISVKVATIATLIYLGIIASAFIIGFIIGIMG